MGTYSTQEFIDTFGGLPEPGEAVPDFDAIRDSQKADSYGVARQLPPYARPHTHELTHQED